MYQQWTEKQGDSNSKLVGFIIKMLRMYSEKKFKKKTVQNKRNSQQNIATYKWKSNRELRQRSETYHRMFSP